MSRSTLADGEARVMERSSDSSSAESAPWYAPGLLFTCTQCGGCCTGEPGFVWVDEEELRAIAEYLGVGYGEVRYMKTRLVGERTSLREHANGDCIFFDGRTRRCTIYPVRPKQCRSWPFWNSHLATREAWREVQARCPGTREGEFVPLEVIQRQASLIDL
jgi:Fe-S-cluster containining protein